MLAGNQESRTTSLGSERNIEKELTDRRPDYPGKGLKHGLLLASRVGEIPGNRVDLCSIINAKSGLS
jgi:hypothetical protein